MKRLLLVLSLAGLLLPRHEVHAMAGQFQFVAGDVRLLQADGRDRPAQKGQAINEGDTIVTGKSGAAQLRMADEGLIALRPDSTLKVETYRFQGKEDGSEKGVFALIKGGFRTLTGIIGRTNKSNYLVRTPTATIGIRGTDHEPLFIPAGGWAGAPGAQPGTYNKVNVGETFIESQGGRIELAANQVGFAAAAAGAVPVRLPAVPDFMRATPMPQGRGDGRGLRENASPDARRNLAEARRGDDRRAPPPMPPRDDRPQLPPEAAGGAFSFIQAAADLQPAPLGFAVAGGDRSNGQFFGSGAGIVAPGQMDIRLDPAGNPVLVADTGGGFRYARSGAPLVDSGGMIVVDPNGGSPVNVPVRWGIYGGGAIVGNQGPRAANYFHFIGAQGTPPAVVAGLSGTYTYVGGGKVVTEMGVGVVPSYDSGFTKVILSSGQVTNYEVKLLDDGYGRTWHGTWSGAVTAQSFAKQGVSLSVSTSPGTSPTGNGHGIPIGPAGKGVLSSFDMRTIEGKAVTGSFVATK